MKREHLKEFFRTLYGDDPTGKSLLREQEEDIFGDDEEGGEEEGGEEEGGDEEGGEDAAEEGGDEEGGEAEEGTSDEDVPLEPGDEVRLGKQFDIAIDSLLQDYEMNAIKSAQIHDKAHQDLEDEVQKEWWSKGLTNLLFEQEGSFPWKYITYGAVKDNKDASETASSLFYWPPLCNKEKKALENHVKRGFYWRSHIFNSRLFENGF